MTLPPEQNPEAAAGNVLKKHLYWVFFYKVANLQASNLIKKRLLHRCFPMKYEIFLKTPILNNFYERLLLCISYIGLYNSLQARIHCEIFLSDTV